MPQPGIHAILALSCRNKISSRPWFALGLVFGSVLPDLDGYASAVAVLLFKMEPSTAESLYHRTWSHSVFFALSVGLFCWLLSLFKGGSSLKTFGIALTIGMIVFHIIPDILIWFDKVGIFWPFISIDLWQNHQPIRYEHSVLQAGNFLAFAAYFGYLQALARRSATNADYHQRLGIYLWTQLVLGASFMVLAFVLLEPAFTRWSGTALLLFAFPNALWVTWTMRQTIEATPMAS